MSAVLRRALRYAAPERRQLAIGVTLQVATVVAGIGLMGTSAWLISRAALHPSIAVLSVAIVGVRFFGVARGLLRYFERIVSHDATLAVLARVRERVYRALEPLAPARTLERASGDLLARLVDDVETLEHVYVRILGPSLAAVVVAVVLALVLASRAHVLVPVALAGMVMSGVLVPAITARVSGRAGREAVRRRAAMSARVVDGVQGVADLLAYGAGPRHRALVERESRTLARLQDRAANVAAFGGALVTLVADLTAAVVLGLGVTLVRHGSLEGVQLAVTVLVTVAAFEIVATLPAACEAAGATHAAASRLFELIDAEPAVRPPLSPLPATNPARLEIRALTFRYPGEPRDALTSLDLELTPGRLVAVVGPSGAGKSTLANLILRFWDVRSRSLLVDGVDIRDLDPDEWRSRVAVGQQRTHLFTGTLRENLLVGNPHAPVDVLGRVVERVGLSGLVTTLPQGLDTWIGEQGLQLSGGERQRLALARVLLSEAPFVVLDEPTAHVDAVTERALLNEIVPIASQRAVLLITHRLVGLERADEIIVLDDGRTIERGTYGELLARRGRFARMLDLQRSIAILDVPSTS